MIQGTNSTFENESLHVNIRNLKQKTDLHSIWGTLWTDRKDCEMGCFVPLSYCLFGKAKHSPQEQE